MQRIKQMHVVPDAIDPKALGIPSAQLDLTLTGWNDNMPIEPGSIVLPET